MTGHPLIKGKRLAKNQTVGVIAPGSPVSKSEIEKGIALLESHHLKPIPGKHLFDSAKYLAGYDIDRASDLHHMFLDPEIKAIFCARGGYGATRLLHMIDFNIIAQNPKILVGFSDITALLFAIYKKTGLITIHGPTLSQLSKNDNLIHLLRLITVPYRPQITMKKGRVIRSGQAKGIILGGNLSIICSLCGTSFLPSFKNKILFIEETGESPYRIDRMLTQLVLTNKLNELSAIVVGEMNAGDEKETIDEILEERLAGLTVPIISGLPVGHGTENISLPLGLPALVDTDGMVLKIEESAVL